MEHENFSKYLDAKFDVRVITPNDGYHYFFGYYDLNVYHGNGKYHLENRVKFMDRLPTKDDVCELGYTDFTSDIEGNMYELIHNGLVSHYHWKNDRQVMFYCECEGIHGVHLLDDMSKSYITYAAPDLTFDKNVTEKHNDIHCIYSPNQYKMRPSRQIER